MEYEIDDLLLDHESLIKQVGEYLLSDGGPRHLAHLWSTYRFCNYDSNWEYTGVKIPALDRLANLIDAENKLARTILCMERVGDMIRPTKIDEAKKQLASITAEIDNFDFWKSRTTQQL